MRIKKSSRLLTFNPLINIRKYLIVVLWISFLNWQKNTDSFWYQSQKWRKEEFLKNSVNFGFGYRSYRITYFDLLFGILTNLSSVKVLVYEFYKQRQTAPNYFRDSNCAEDANKLPSQKFRAFLRLFMVDSSSPKRSSVVGTKMFARRLAILFLPKNSWWTY